MERVKTAKGRTTSSVRWLQRQLNDPYVIKARKEGYRARSAYKILEIDEKAHIFKKGQKVVDLGAAPGGWCQVAMKKGCSHVVAIDLLEIDELPGVTFFQRDFMDDDVPELLAQALGGLADVVMSDMAHNTIGHQRTDHVKIMALVDTAYEFAYDVLAPGGTFVAKVFQGGTENELLARMKKDFKTVKHIKPPASRKESPETYVIAQGFRAVKEQ